MSDFVQVSDKPLSGRERALMQRLFSDPASLPDEFKRWVADYVSTNGSLHVSAMPSLKGEEFRFPTFATTWVDFDSVRKVRFYCDASGIVRLGGIAKSGTIGTTIFTLPEGYRPGFTDASVGLIFPVVSNAAFGYCDIRSDGQVIAAAGNNTYFSLDGITFRAA